MAAQQPSDQTAQGAPPETDYAPPAPALPPPIPPTGFVLPDLPDGWKNYTSYDGCWFSTAFSVVPLIDYNAFVQDADSKTQVDEQNDEWDLRTLRLMFRGQMKFPHPVDYLISVEVKGQDHVQTDASQFGFTDVEFSTLVGKLGRLSTARSRNLSSTRWSATRRISSNRSVPSIRSS